MTTITYNAKPMPAPRPRVTRFGTYNDPKYTEWKKGLATIAKLSKFYTENAVALDIEFIFEYPKSWSAKKREQIWHTSRPDGDNLIKSCLDSLNGICYKDDAQVCQIKAIKRYGKNACILIDIYEI